MKKLIFIFSFMLTVLVSTNFKVNAEGYHWDKGYYVKLNSYTFKVLNPETNLLIFHGNLENRSWGSSSSNYNPGASGSIAHYLNTTFLNNLGDFKDYINNYSGMGWKIGLITINEYNAYKSLIPANGTSWWTRTPYTGDQNYIINTSGEINTSIWWNAHGVRPTLYLKPGLYSAGTGSLGDPIIISTTPIVYLPEVSTINLVETTSSSIKIAWNNPKDSELFSHVNIYKDDVLIESNFKEETYDFKGLTYSKNYKFTIKTVGIDGKISDGKSIVVSTQAAPIVPDVMDTKAEAKHDRVNISWKKPESEYFHHVNVYRKVLAEKTALTTVNDLLFGSKVSASTTADGYQEMFETNGTYWNDLTVKPETEYSYKLTTENVAGVESLGVTVKAVTGEEPPPVLTGEEYEKRENGDYLYKWAQPSTGKIKVLIDGVLFKTVPASDKQVLIPKEKMRFDIFNNPKVVLIPVSDDGKEGQPTKPSDDTLGGVKMPFSPKDLLTSSMGFLGLLAPIVLLCLALILFKPIKNLVIRAAQKNRERKMYE